MATYIFGLIRGKSLFSLQDVPSETRSLVGTYLGVHDPTVGRQSSKNFKLMDPARDKGVRVTVNQESSSLMASQAGLF